MSRYWSMFLSYFVAFIATLIIVPTLYFVCRSFAVKRSLLIALVSFVPTCIGVNLATDAYTFREHHYEMASDVGFRIVRANIPENARNIELHYTKGAFFAKYKIDEFSLNDWFKKVWEQNGERALFEMKVPQPRLGGSQVASLVAGYGWVVPVNCIEYEGPIYENGSGSHLCFDTEGGTAYQFYAFW